MATNPVVPAFRDGQRVRCVIAGAPDKIHEGKVHVRCGFRDKGDWWVKLSDGRTVPVFQSNMEAVPYGE